MNTICIVGLGYVGLPLAHAFAQAEHTVTGFDVDSERINELKNGKDRTNELTEKKLSEVTITFSDDPAVIGTSEVVILAIPTPVTEDKKPDLTLLKSATKTVSQHMQDGVIVVFESTVYPGVTEDICGAILKKSGKSYTLGYSPERVNPGDREHTIEKIVKVVAGEDEETSNKLCELYSSIIKAGIHRAPSIKVAEMSKAIENAQRDLNIAYMNEIAKLCDRLGIRTQDVLEAAGTKWNFLPFTPGLVGGHCIGVDPYYLVELAHDKNTILKLIEGARETNDGMAQFVANQVIDALPSPKDSNVLILGMTFKEGVPDFRNSQSPVVQKYLESAGCEVVTHDPFSTSENPEGKYNAILFLVPHREYCDISPEEFAKLAKDGCVFYDLKSVFNKKEIEAVGMWYISL